VWRTLAAAAGSGLALLRAPRVAAALRRFSTAALLAAALPAMTCSLCTRHQAHTIGTVSVCWQALMGFLDGSGCGEVGSDAVKAWQQGCLQSSTFATRTCYQKLPACTSL
jgi:hypothetical protein